MPETLRILHLIEKNGLATGSVVQMMEAARGLAGRGHRVTVASRPGGDLEDGCTEDGLPFFGLPLGGPADLRSALRLRRQLRSGSADIVHVHKGGPHSIALLAAAGLGPRPILVVNRGVSFPLDAFNKWKYRHPRVGRVVCVAEAVREVVIRSGGLRPEKVVTIHGSTDTSRFDPSHADPTSLRRDLGLSPDHLLVAQVSVRAGKGWRELLAAFGAAASRNPDARLVLVGCEPTAEREKVEAAVRGAGLGDRVLTLPCRRDMPDVLAACDVVVDASMTGTGVTGAVREAMALERAVVASDCGGNRELVIDGEVGLLVPPRDVSALAAAMERLLGNTSLRARLGRAARQRVISHFSTERRLDKLESLYQQIVE